MAGNLVKWWKHKILGGYKQFSVQECTTDSEELMYHQVRASSSCSAPPDLLLVSDRENNIPLRSPVVNIIGATTAPATTTTSPSSGVNACHITSVTNNNQRHNQKLIQQQQQQQQQQLLLLQQQQQQQQQHHHVTTQQLSLAYNCAKDIGGNVKHQKPSGIDRSSHSKHGHQQQQDCQQQPQQQQQVATTAAHDIEGQMETQLNNHSSARHAHHTQYQQQHHPHHQQQQQRTEEHIRLEEFTCDVSVEGGKSSQPLQFSFTFYDLDGHHGKITKDDIVGIVYTIYESIGKSVVVPHSGSKTINVRLTVSPEGKSKTAKNNKKTTSGSAMAPDSVQRAASASQAARRLHRYRPRKLIKSDEEDDDSNSDKDRENTHVNASSSLSQVLAHKATSKSHKLLNKLKTEQQCCNQQQSLPPSATEIPNSPLETTYDNVKAVAVATTPPEACRECQAAVDESRNSAAISPTAQYPANKTTTTANEAYMKHVASTRIKMLRKSRKQKHQDCLETRQRSLSVGNETCWKNRHLQKPHTQQQLPWHADQPLNHSGVDVVDGVQLRNPLRAHKSVAGALKRNSAECWKTALNRNDLISIIRESMEKNRLCFQLNGKPQANVSPIRHSQTPLQQTQQHHPQHLVQHQQNTSNKHSQQLQTSTATAAATVSQQRQRSNTVSKIPTLIANHNNSHSVSPQQSHYTSGGRQRSSSCVNTISSSNNNNNNNNNDAILHKHHNSTNSSNNIYHHLQPHIPIYHQQLAINPVVIAAHNGLLNAASGSSSAAGHHGKMNLCGYDSFLHATICSGGLSHSPPPATSSPAIISNSSTSQQHQQQIATVQPIMSTNNTQNTSAKHLSLAVTPTQIKTSKILRSGSYAQTHHQHQSSQVHSNATQNSPQYHGYQRLPSSSKHNLAALHLVSPTMEKPPLDQLDKWRRDQVKNYDQLLYAKLSEKLQQTNLVATTATGRENNQRRKHRVLKHRRANALIAEANNVTLNSKVCIRDDSDYATTLHIDGDSVECENLLAQTSDEESHSQHEAPAQTPEELIDNSTGTRHVAEGTLVDLDDEDTHLTHHTKRSLNSNTLLGADSEVNQLHLLDDALEIEEDLAQVLDEDLAEVVVATETGRNSTVSNESNNTGATLANTAAASTSNTSSSSLIHRYVHEHIHHHYHHFEGKEE